MQSQNLIPSNQKRYIKQKYGKHYNQNLVALDIRAIVFMILQALVICAFHPPVKISY